VHDLHDLAVLGHSHQCLPDCLDELLVESVMLGGGQEIDDVVLSEGGDLHDGDEGGALAIEILDVDSKH
jgi:hypothetical protein